jgi:hypothetical protein
MIFEWTITLMDAVCIGSWYAGKMTLSQEIRAHYLENFSRLPFGKQFHFAGRLASWQRDSQCQALLEDLKPQLLPGENQSIRELLQGIIAHQPEAKMNAQELRAPYFEKYPDLRGYGLALFRVRHLLYVYGVDARQELLELVPLDELNTLAEALKKDHDAMRALSTHAINYIYMVQHVLYNDRISLHDEDIQAFYDLGSGYNPHDKMEALLLIYFYTHCIIGESNFYNQAVSPERLPTYVRMLDHLESIIETHFTDINLDNKLEFLVCCRILGRQSSLRDRIYQECEQSVSPEGMFLIDTVNTPKRSNKTSFASSEHRNVLFIMSTLPYLHQA